MNATTETFERDVIERAMRPERRAAGTRSRAAHSEAG